MVIKRILTWIHRQSCHSYYHHYSILITIIYYNYYRCYGKIIGNRKRWSPLWCLNCKLNVHSTVIWFLMQLQTVLDPTQSYRNQYLTKELTSSSNILFRLSSLLLVCDKSAFFLSSFLFLSLLSFSSFSSSASYWKINKKVHITWHEFSK